MAVARWRDAAKRCGIKRGEVDRMASAFEHGDLKAALACVTPAAGARRSSC